MSLKIVLPDEPERVGQMTPVLALENRAVRLRMKNRSDKHVIVQKVVSELNVLLCVEVKNEEIDWGKNQLIALRDVATIYYL